MNTAICKEENVMQPNDPASDMSDILCYNGIIRKYYLVIPIIKGDDYTLIFLGIICQLCYALSPVT